MAVYHRGGGKQAGSESSSTMERCSEFVSKVRPCRPTATSSMELRFSKPFRGQDKSDRERAGKHRGGRIPSDRIIRNKDP